MKKKTGSNNSDNSIGHVSKKCPECLAYMPLHVDVCPECKAAVGKVDKHGMASRKTDWKAYVVAIAAWIFFFFYIWWAFLREQ